jgi:hypothetical protein
MSAPSACRPVAARVLPRVATMAVRAACVASIVTGAENAVPLRIESCATLAGVPFMKPTSYA